MDAETQHSQDHGFASSHWDDIGAFNSPHHPLGDYQGFPFGTSQIVPLEPAYNMSLSQPYTPQPLGPLTMPPAWPAMLSTQPTYGPVPLAPMPISSLVHLQNVHTPHVPHSPAPRRTLTDTDRRNMCMYHEENPHVKQTEIGAMFGVERSTVSKVLRQKEKYLYPEEGSTSPTKRSKVKFPDIEKALSNWARNHQRQGRDLSDAMIKEKALFFANSVGNGDGHQKLLNSAWLEKFKKKNGLFVTQTRKNSIDTGNTSETTSTVNSGTQTPCSRSPLSPSIPTSPSPISPKKEFDVFRKGSIDCITTQRTEDFSHVFSPTTSPLETIAMSNHISSAFISEKDSTGHQPKKQRSQTLEIPSLEQKFISDESADPGRPQVLQPSVIEDTANGITDETVITNGRPRPEINTESIQSPIFSQSNPISPISSPSSPTQDEARQALELVKSYFRNRPSGVETQDLAMINKLICTLDLVHTRNPTLDPIDEHTDFPRMTKKRSIHAL
ncbi:hypothetical protein LOZ53_001821 [Ophidiomyces ophidiicola]|nr:uncharacterized protein LOZ57_002263 [Ophidiomyces ophidiicola]KAI1912236.1 hypothetical protein LOZ61_003398 [Ophidiomyces ophidiicola]KAI1949785.1 hypothetical protein LOZ57_002263 [Ophidiomyces ophidiicola]KAI1957092.1 hypothetical protein LOZ59_004052 [Ophidiomyces ophidiicola]KAI1986159.1 hypothetical protein LOZ51_006128 [Ophidiomyces ophidiicola]KAI1994264.1 hypothetical protein LOZ53_001821 [Ophidiomyces ophidiicola]